jgi:hypothetical protein
MTFNPWHLISKIVGFISAVILAFNRGKKAKEQENINNNYKEVIKGAKRKKKRNLDSDTTVRERLLKNARDRK